MSRPYKVVMALDKTAEWSLYAIIFVLPFSKSIIEICVVIGLVSVLLKKMIKKERLFELDAVNVLLCIFVLASIPSFLNTPDIHLSVRAFFSKTLKFAALFLLAREIIGDRRKLANFIAIALISCVIILTDGLIQYFFTNVDLLRNYPSFKFVETNPFYPGAPTASFPYPNDFAAWMIVFIFPVITYIFFADRPWHKTVSMSLLGAVLFYMFLLAKVRGAWLSFAASFFVMLIFKASKFMIIFFAVILIAAIMMQNTFFVYVTSLTTVYDRGKMWEHSLEIFKRHPVIGNGLNTFYINYMMIRDDESKGIRGSYAHNCYLQMAADIGLLGLLSFLAFISAIMLKGIRSFKNSKDPVYGSFILGLTFGIFAFLAHSALDTNLYSLPLAALFWLVSGVLLAVIKLSKEPSAA